MRVEVTLEDIEQGSPQSGYHCAIARAFERTWQLEEGGRWFVDANVAFAEYDTWMGRDGTRYIVPLPEQARAFIEAFDKGLPVEPFAFDVED